VPKVISNEGKMKHILLQDNTLLKLSNYGVPEPVSGIETEPPLLDIVFVPLLAFDTKGNRVGYGKGFYDRFLATCKKEAIFIGLSFFEAETISEKSNLDIPLHYCITPKGIYSF
jgi:5-formyltetrahydrofolate cyclo-ligase